MSVASAITRRLSRAALRFHRDEQGGMLDYLLVLAVVGITLMGLMWKFMDILAEYFAMIAFFIGWPFL